MKGVPSTDMSQPPPKCHVREKEHMRLVLARDFMLSGNCMRKTVEHQINQIVA